MSVVIGAMQDSPQQCGDQHLPGCFNPMLDITACLCGNLWWRGNVGVWISRGVYSSAGRDAVLLGYDVYFLPGNPL